MPVFSNQLGSLRGMSAEESVPLIANHIRIIQEQLEYRLLNLDSSNIASLDVEKTTWLANGKPVNNVLQDQSGLVSSLQQTVNGFNMTVKDYNEKYSQWTQTVEGFQQTVQGYEGQMI